MEWALGGLFLYAAYFKLLDPSSFAIDLQNYRMLPTALLAPVALVIPALELLGGLSLILGFWRVEGSFWILVMMLCFLGAEVQALVRGLDVNCGCFGKGSAKLTYETLVRNGAIFVVTFWVLVREIRLRKELN
jgi:hypothetical protein